MSVVEAPPIFGRALPASPIPDLELLENVGRGTRVVMYRARQISRNRIVILSMLPIAKHHGEFTARFPRVAKILTRLHHPHLVACLQAGLTAANHPYVVRACIDGQYLGQYLADHGPLAWRDAVQVTRDLASALGHAHDQGLIHRDVQASNVALAPRPGDDVFPFVAKLVNLGLTPTLGISEPAEQMDFRGDIHDLGGVLLHALTGHLDTPLTGLPEGVTRLVSWMREPNPDARPGSYADVIAACDRLLGGPRLGRRGNRSAWLAVVAALGACGIGAALALAPATTKARKTSPPVAPMPAPPPSVSLTSQPWGPPQALWSADSVHRLDDWTPSIGAQWTSAESRADAVAGFAGRVSKDLGPLPWRLSGHLHLFSTPDLITDALGLGVELANGQRMVLQVQQHNGVVTAILRDVGEGAPSPGGQPHVLGQGLDIPVVLLVGEGELLATVAGHAFERMPLAAQPRAVVLTIAGDSPGEISGLVLQRPVTP